MTILGAEVRNSAAKALDDGRFISLLDHYWLDVYWPAIKSGIASYSELFLEFDTLDGYYMKAKLDVMQVFVVGTKERIDLVLFTEFRTSPVEKWLRVVGAWGNTFDEYTTLIIATINDYAAMQGCDKVEIVGRRGWVRKLKAAGFHEKYVSMHMVVDKTRSLN